MRAKTKRRLAKYWGYVLVVVLGIGWFFVNIPPLILIALSLLVVVYMLFQAPVPCCARTRQHEYCRNNAGGLLRGCHLEAHKWQNLRMMVKGDAWGQLGRGMFRRMSGNAAAISTLAGVVSAIAAVIALAVK